jgi:hypothetical protein
MTGFSDQLTRFLVSCYKAFEEDSANILECKQEDSSPGSWSHENYRYITEIFLALYKVKNKNNPYYGNDDCLQKYIQLADSWVLEWESARANNGKVSYAEWPPFIILRGLDQLKSELSDEMRSRWVKCVTWFADETVPQPFFFTAPNHEIWKQAIAALAGRVLKRPDLLESARFKANQLLSYQEPEGFWEEGRHHGPSMKYNSLMLGGLTIVARETADPRILDGAARLARFMCTWNYPDGVLPGTFDGRQSTSPGYFGILVPGLDLAPEGFTHMQRILDFWERTGWIDDPGKIGPSNWYAHFGMPFAAESLFYLNEKCPKSQADQLPLDADGACLENHSTVFDGLMQRKGDWVLALSGQISDVPKDCQFIYRLERQSRIEIWHKQASVVVGGGHSLVNCAWPLYNTWIETGYGDEPDPKQYANSGSLEASPAYALRRSKYYARSASTELENGNPRLQTCYANCSSTFDLCVSGDDVTIKASWQQLAVKQLRLAIPMVIWRGGSAFADGQQLPAASIDDPALIEIDKSLTVETPIFGSKVSITVPTGGSNRVIWPLEPVRTYGQLFEEEHYQSFFRIALVETVIDNPETEGAVCWKLSVEGNMG